MLKYVLIGIRANVQNETIFFYSNRKILHLTMLIVCRKNLSQKILMDCKSITFEGEEKVFLVESLNRSSIVKIQSPRSHKKQMPS